MAAPIPSLGNSTSCGGASDVGCLATQQSNFANATGFLSFFHAWTCGVRVWSQLIGRASNHACTSADYKVSLLWHHGPQLDGFFH